jgi:2'-5' RNA ligase/GNAT superfamily N-acetyltransferase
VALNRRRLGVALVLDPPIADEVDGLRRALGDPGLGRVPPHLTLVPPVNVRAADLPAALSRLRRAAARVAGPLRVTLGPATSFLPANPVLYLAVGGELGALRTLRDAVFAPPFERPLSWPWVPHVTIADGVAPERVVAGVAALDRYARVIDVDRVVLLEEGSARTWTPVADAALGPPRIVGRGGLTLELTQSRMIDPEAVGLVGECDPSAAAGPFHPIFITARREGRVTGLAAAWTDPLGGRVSVVVGAAVRGEGVGTHLLAHVEDAARRAGWPYERLAAVGPAGFYSARSAWARP